jgi:WD40 repeat protein
VCNRCLAFTADGKTLASAGDDPFVTLWDPATGLERRRLEGHPGPVCAIAISPDGKTQESGSDGMTALVWVLTTDAPKPAATDSSAPK